MIAVIIFLIAVYVILIIVFTIGWKSIKRGGVNNNAPRLFYSIIIAFRNEEKHLPAIISSLKNIQFSTTNYEIIFVNDHSTDESVNILQKNKFSSNWEVLHLEDGEGKKAALELGIKHSNGDVIITTDADCIMSPLWLNSFQSFFEDKDAVLVSGAVTFYTEVSWFEKLQTIEFASLIGIGAASIALGIPGMCNGANLAFKKEAFYQVGGYEGNKKYASGDDTFLLYKLFKKFPSLVYFNKSPYATISTKAQQSVKAFFYQRKRWASKWKIGDNYANAFLALIIFLSNVSFFIGFVLLLTDEKLPIILYFLIFAKCLAEGILLYSVLKFCAKRLNVFRFLILQLSYPLYAIFFGIAANFGGYIWKGRKH